MKNKYMIYVTLLIILLSFVIGITYSYLVVKINGTETSSTINVESGTLSISYENNSGTITLKNIIPGNSVTKQFTLTGINNTKPNALTSYTDLKYKIGIAVDVNTFSKGSLTYTLARDSSSSTNGKLANNSTGIIKQEGTQFIGNGYFTNGANNDKHIYKLTISFPETNKDQSIDQGATFACHVIIKENLMVEPTTFAEDSWETIANVVESGNGTAYPIGSEKEVEIDGTSYTVRVANNTTPDECNTEGFSQTACGFVVEFTDIIDKRITNSSISNIGGWSSSIIRSYANNNFYNKLPKELQNVIINTYVVSGHAYANYDIDPKRTDGNWETIDKIYLLGAHEVYEDGTSDKVSLMDKAYSSTRQLDYYALKGVTTSDYTAAIKQYGKSTDSSDNTWWLRTAYSGSDDNSRFFHGVNAIGGLTKYYTSETRGFAPAFRIGNKEEFSTSSQFAEDSWETIAKVVESGNGTAYTVGSEKEVEIDGTSYTVRVANNTTPDECNTEGFSQTSCGFVVEFVDIIEKKAINSSITNGGGWASSVMRTYANGDFYNKLPKELQNVIINTYVVSGHAFASYDVNSNRTDGNWETIDKIYLLGMHEVYEDGTSDKVSTMDKAYNSTRQLDYYALKGVTTSDYSNAIKRFNSSDSYDYTWWLRTAYSGSDDNSRFFHGVDAIGGLTKYYASETRGFAPAFRIG